MDEQSKKRDLYWQRRFNELERRIEKLEAQLAAGRGQPVNGDYYTVREFAQAMGVSRSTVERWRDKGIITCMKFGRTCRIPKSELEAVMDM